MSPGAGFYKLAGDTYPVSRLTHAALEDIAHTKFATDLPDVDRLSLIDEGRIAGDDEEFTKPRQRCDDVLDHSISKILLLRVASHVLKWQDGDGRLVGERERLLGLGARGHHVFR